MKVLEPYRPPLVTDLEDGISRGRRSTTKNIAKVQLSIRMDNSEFDTFKAWVRDDLVDGTLPFTMSVWTGSVYATRTCSLVGKTYQADPAEGFYNDVSMTLDVEDY
jgi:hypothetical protein